MPKLIELPLFVDPPLEDGSERPTVFINPAYVTHISDGHYQGQVNIQLVNGCRSVSGSKREIAEKLGFEMQRIPRHER